MNRDMLVGFEVEFISFLSRERIKKDLLQLFSNYRTPGYIAQYGWPNTSSCIWNIHSDGSVYMKFSDFVKRMFKRKYWHSIEISSPALRLPDALDALKNIFDYMDKNDMVVNKTCGLHINISLPGFANKKRMKEINRLKLLSLLDEIAILNQFSRRNNRYCRPHLPRLLKKFHKIKRFRQIIGKNWNNVLPALKEDLKLSTDKYRTVNFSKLGYDTPYLEFRLMGGKNYHKRFDEIEKNILHFCDIVEDATSYEESGKYIDLLKEQYIRLKWGNLYFMVTFSRYLSTLISKLRNFDQFSKIKEGI